MAQTVLGTTLILVAVAIAGIAYYAALTPTGVGIGAFFVDDATRMGADQRTGAVFATPMAAGAKIEPVTGTHFPLVRTFRVGKDMKLLGVGVRKKSILNVYSVGFYGARQVVRAVENKSGLWARCNAAIAEKLKGSRAVVLNFNMGIGARKMAEACANVEGPTQQIKDEFMSIVTNGIGGKMKKGEEMTLEWKGADTVVVTVRGIVVGEIRDKAMFQGLLRIYLGERSVSPTLKADIGEAMF